MNSKKQTGIRTTSVTTRDINAPTISRLNYLMSQIFITGPGNGTNYQFNQNFIQAITKSLTPIITASVIKNLCDSGCIDSPCCYYYTNDCCGDNNVKDLNMNLNNVLNSFNIDDNNFSLLSTEILEDITSNNSEEIDSVESIETVDSIESIEIVDSVESVESIETVDSVESIEIVESVESVKSIELVNGEVNPNNN